VKKPNQLTLLRIIGMILRVEFRFFLAGEFWCFVGVFEKRARFGVVIWWCGCGDLRGGCGV
jgi:hypothetical protein